MKKALRTAVSLVASLALAAGLVPAAAFAGSDSGADEADDDTASGYVADYSTADAVAAADDEADEADAGLATLSSDTVTASGTCGTVTWTLYDDGELVLAPTSGDEGTLESFSGHYNGAPWYRYNNKITSVDITGTVHAGESLGYMFYDCYNMESADLSGLDTSNVTDMSDMFSCCESLTSLDVSGFDTSSVADMSCMFYGCSSLTTLDLSGFDTSNVTDMSYMFSCCESLTSLDVSGLDTSGAVYMGGMFYGCSSLTSLDVSGLDTSNAMSVSYMFYGCESLTSLDLSGFDTSSVADMGGMFGYCTSLTTLDLSGFDTSSVADMSYMFYRCTSLTTVYVSDLWSTESVGYYYESYYEYEYLYEYVFDYSEAMFYGCTSLVGGNGTTYSSDHVDKEYARIDADGEPGYFTYKACEASSDNDVDASVTASGIWGTVTWTLYDDGELNFAPTSGDEGTLASFQEGKNASCAPWTVYYAEDIVSVSVTGTVVCGSNVSYMFAWCTSLTSVDLTGLDTSNVTEMQGMFYECPSLTTLDLSGFDTSNVTKMYDMFADYYYGSSLTTIYVSELWSTESLVDDDYMFDGCTSLVGGNGTAYSADHVDSEYARIDTDDTPGYFTDIADYEAVTRLAGSNRYSTMAAIVEEAYAGQTCDYAVLATGANFADALAAASLAGALDAPVVLVKPGDPSAAIEVLQGLGCEYAYVVGGTSAVSASDVEAIEEACGVETERVAGSNRRETALEVAEAANGLAAERSDTCIVATGAEFADALSASPYSYWAAAPIYLAKTDGTLDSATLAAIEEAGYDTVVVMGGTSAVTAGAEAALESLGVDVVRLSGSNRYDTCTAMAQWSVAQGMTYDGAAVATGAAFPDALAGATLCGRAGSVLLLAKDGRTQAIDLLADASGVDGVYILGGESAVSASLAALVEAALG